MMGIMGLLAPTVGRRALTAESLWEFGSRVGFWRLLEVFDERVIAIPVREDGNHIVFAFRDPAFAPRWHRMRSQARRILSEMFQLFMSEPGVMPPTSPWWPRQAT